MDLDSILSGSVSVTAKAGDANAIENSVADFIEDVSPALHTMSHTVNVLPPAGTVDDKPLVVSESHAHSSVADNTGPTSSFTAGTVHYKAQSAGGTYSTLLSNQPSALATPNGTADSTLPLKCGSGGVKPSL